MLLILAYTKFDKNIREFSIPSFETTLPVIRNGARINS